MKLHNEWLKKYGYYKDMYKKASRDDAEKEYKKKVACYPWDLMKYEDWSMWYEFILHPFP